MNVIQLRVVYPDCLSDCTLKHQVEEVLAFSSLYDTIKKARAAIQMEVTQQCKDNDVDWINIDWNQHAFGTHFESIDLAFSIKVSSL